MDKRTKAKINAYNSSGNIFKLRSRKIDKGYSLYYEICRKDVRRRRFSLGLYIKGTSGAYADDLDVIADAVKKLRSLNRKYEINNSLSFLGDKEKKEVIGEANFFKIFERYYMNKYKKQSTRKTFQNVSCHLKLFSKGTDYIRIKDITTQFCDEFKNYLDRTKLKNSSKKSYLEKFKQVVSELVERKFIDEDPIPKRYSFKSNIPDRQFLSREEIIKLMVTPYPEYSLTVCKAFIFGCFSGFRWEDIAKLKFTDINNGKIKIIQGKTAEFVEFSLPPQAIDIIKHMGRFNDLLVFEGIGSNDRGNKKIKQWVKDAGINKKVTWHTARHTFACMLLLNDVDIYHVSKLMGHTSIKSTMKYLHVLREHTTKASEALSDIHP